MKQEQTTITIKKIFENEKGPHKIFDTKGGSWKIWPDVLDQLNLKEGSSYEIQYKSGEYNGKPDNVIKSAIGAGAGDGPAVAANGHAAPAPGDRDKAILTAVLAKLVGPIPLGTREQMANEMTLIYLAAQDACERIVS